VSETLPADSADERRRGSSSSASSVAASSDSYCPPDEWQQVAIKTCVMDDAKAIAKPAPGEKQPLAVDACAERHRAPGARRGTEPQVRTYTTKSADSTVDSSEEEEEGADKWVPPRIYQEIPNS
jgi:hypothetical protein